jgi:hypothetical protein
MRIITIHGVPCSSTFQAGSSSSFQRSSGLIFSSNFLMNRQFYHQPWGNYLRRQSLQEKFQMGILGEATGRDAVCLHHAMSTKNTSTLIMPSYYHPNPPSILNCWNVRSASLCLTRNYSARPWTLRDYPTKTVVTVPQCTWNHYTSPRTAQFVSNLPRNPSVHGSIHLASCALTPNGIPQQYAHVLPSCVTGDFNTLKSMQSFGCPIVLTRVAICAVVKHRVCRKICFCFPSRWYIRWNSCAWLEMSTKIFLRC